MNRSDTLTSIAPAWVAALNQLEDITRDQVADMGTYSYRYADLATVCQHAREVLAEHDLAVHQEAHRSDYDEFKAANAQTSTVSVTTTVWHSSGEWIEAAPLLMPAKGGPQDIGSAITYARRYALMAFLGLATDDDDGAGAQQAATAPHPLSDRVGKVLQDVKGLTDTLKADMKTWADGRSLAGSAMLNDQAWLELVEAWIDEHGTPDG